MTKIQVYNPSQQIMFTKEFLQIYPLYRSFIITRHVRLDFLKYSPSIKQHCIKCNEKQTYNFKSYDSQDWMSRVPSGNGIEELYRNKSLKINYECKGCSNFELTFIVKFSDDAKTVQKIGQYPGYSVSGDRQTSSMLGEAKLLYRKGLICESQSFGIAAFAYYRRIVELNMKNILLKVSEIFDNDIEKGKYVSAIELIVVAKIAAEKIKIIFDLLPPSMKPFGNNPLKLIYEILSIGIHELSDEECLDFSIDLRKNIEAFIHLLNVNAESILDLSESTKKLLARRTEILKK